MDSPTRVAPSRPQWGFLTNHALVLICISHDAETRLRDISEQIGITERAVHRIVTELAAAGYITRERVGRRNTYTIDPRSPVPDPLVRRQSIGELLGILTTT
jgi:DNA-binding transcriptional ArsR family regulator